MHLKLDFVHFQMATTATYSKILVHRQINQKFEKKSIENHNQKKKKIMALHNEFNLIIIKSIHLLRYGNNKNSDVQCTQWSPAF